MGNANGREKKNNDKNGTVYFYFFSSPLLYIFFFFCATKTDYQLTSKKEKKKSKKNLLYKRKDLKKTLTRLYFQCFTEVFPALNRFIYSLYCLSAKEKWTFFLAKRRKKNRRRIKDFCFVFFFSICLLLLQ